MKYKSLILTLITLSAATIYPAEAQISYGNGGSQRFQSDLSDPRSMDRELFDTYYLNAIQAKLEGDYNTAIDMLKACRKLDPNNPAIYYEMAQILAGARNFEYAAQYAQEAVKVDTTSNCQYVETAISYLIAANQLSDAIPLYDTLIVRKPNDANRNILMKAAVQQAAGRVQESLKTLDAIHTEDQSFLIDAGISRATGYRALGKTKQEKKIFKSLIAKYPQNAKLNFEYSRYFYNIKDYDNSIEYCRRATQLPDGEMYNFVLADIYLGLKMDSLFAQTDLNAFANPNIAVESKTQRLFDVLNRPDQMMTSANWRGHYDRVFSSLLGLYPDDETVVSMAQNYYSTTGRDDKGFRLLTSYVDRNAGNDYIWRNILFRIQTSNGDSASLDSLVSYSCRACQDIPTDPFYVLINAQSLQMSSRYSDALKRYGEAFSTYDNNRSKETDSQRTLCLHGMAQCYSQLDSTAEAFAVYEQLLSEDPNDAVALNNYAYKLAQMDLSLDRAEKMSQRSLKSEPLNGTYLDTYAYILFRQGRYVEALFVMERCADATGSDVSAEMLDHYGDILNANGRRSEAVDKWKKALELDPDNQKIQSKINNN